MIVCLEDGVEWSPEEYESCPGCAVSNGEPIRKIAQSAPRAPEDANAGINEKLVELQAATPVLEETDAPPPPVEPEPVPSEPGDTGDDGAREITLEELAALRAAGDFVIVLLGFPTAGKTFFLNRLQHELCNGTYTCRRKMATSEDLIQNTRQFSAHRFQNARDGDFVLIDIPGEAFAQGAPRQFLDPHADALMRAVIHTGQAFLVMLPADETLLSEHARRVMPEIEASERSDALKPGEDEMTLRQIIDAIAELNARLKRKRNAAAAENAEALKAERSRLIDRGRATIIQRLAGSDARLKAFITVIGDMAKLMSFIERNGSPDLPVGFQPHDLDAYKKSPDYKPPTKPVMVVLSKLDELTDSSKAVQAAIKRLTRDVSGSRDVLKTLASEPGKVMGSSLLGLFRKPLVSQFDAWFENASFQCAMAFKGLPKDSKTVNYDLDHKGVTQIVERINQQKKAFRFGLPWTRGR